MNTMRLISSIIVLAITTGIAGSAGAVPLERGRAGLVEVPVRVHNGGATALACEANLAHWYSERLGGVAPGETLTTTLFVKPETGAVFLLNASEDRMPVERLWCGLDGRSWETRAEISLERKADTVVSAVGLDCRADGAETVCTREDR